jgi:putative redox protein
MQQAQMSGHYEGELRTKLTHIVSQSTVLTDAPKDNQGKGEQFSPTDLVCAALASCMMTIIGIASHTHGFSVQDTDYQITKVMQASPRKIIKIKVEFFFKHAYTAHHQSIIEHAARTCPVALSLDPAIEQEIIFHNLGTIES